MRLEMLAVFVERSTSLSRALYIRWLVPYLFWKSSPVHTAHRERVTHSSSFGFGLPGISDGDPHPTAERSCCVRCQSRQCGNQSDDAADVLGPIGPTTVIRASSKMHLHINIDMNLGLLFRFVCLLFTYVESKISVFDLKRFQNLKRVSRHSCSWDTFGHFRIVQAQLLATVESHEVLSSRTPKVLDLQSAFLLLLFCASSKATYCLRVCNPNSTIRRCGSVS